MVDLAESSVNLLPRKAINNAENAKAACLHEHIRPNVFTTAGRGLPEVSPERYYGTCHSSIPVTSARFIPQTVIHLPRAAASLYWEMESSSLTQLALFKGARYSHRISELSGVPLSMMGAPTWHNKVAAEDDSAKAHRLRRAFAVS